MNLIQKVEIPEGAAGAWRVERFESDAMDFRSMIQGRGVPVGETFTRLMRGGTVVMSDTPAEMRDHYTAVRNARGSCLINGLGIGMVLKAILAKPDVTDVTVVELAREVIDLVSPSYACDRVKFVHADAMTYQPPKGKRYGMVWHDIWDSICADNLDDMKALHRKYGPRADWQGSWCRSQCERAEQEWRRSPWSKGWS
jgi:spermidine synthase